MQLYSQKTSTPNYTLTLAITLSQTQTVAVTLAYQDASGLYLRANGRLTGSPNDAIGVNSKSVCINKLNRSVSLTVGGVITI